MKIYPVIFGMITLLAVSCSKKGSDGDASLLSANTWQINKEVITATSVTAVHVRAPHYLKADDGNNNIVVFYFAYKLQIPDGSYKVVDGHNGQPENLDEISIVTIKNGSNGLVSSNSAISAEVKTINDKLSVKVTSAPMVDVTTSEKSTLSANLTEL